MSTSGVQRSAFAKYGYLKIVCADSEWLLRDGQINWTQTNLLNAVPSTTEVPHWSAVDNFRPPVFCKCGVGSCNFIRLFCIEQIFKVYSIMISKPWSPPTIAEVRFSCALAQQVLRRRRLFWFRKESYSHNRVLARSVSPLGFRCCLCAIIAANGMHCRSWDIWNPSARLWGWFELGWWN